MPSMSTAMCRTNTGRDAPRCSSTVRSIRPRRTATSAADRPSRCSPTAVIRACRACVGPCRPPAPDLEVDQPCRRQVDVDRRVQRRGLNRPPDSTPRAAHRRPRRVVGDDVRTEPHRTPSWRWSRHRMPRARPVPRRAVDRGEVRIGLTQVAMGGHHEAEIDQHRNVTTRPWRRWHRSPHPSWSIPGRTSAPKGCCHGASGRPRRQDLVVPQSDQAHATFSRAAEGTRRCPVMASVRCAA